MHSRSNTSMLFFSVWDISKSKRIECKPSLLHSVGVWHQNINSIRQLLLYTANTFKLQPFFLADCNKLAFNWSEHTEVPVGRRGLLTEHSPGANSCTSSTVTLPPSFFFKQQKQRLIACIYFTVQSDLIQKILPNSCLNFTAWNFIPFVAITF